VAIQVLAHLLGRSPHFHQVGEGGGIAPHPIIVAIPQAHLWGHRLETLGGSGVAHGVGVEIAQGGRRQSGTGNGRSGSPTGQAFKQCKGILAIEALLRWFPDFRGCCRCRGSTVIG
jgi:hypothetical protein